MSYNQDIWYNELYRIFAEDVLLDVHQVRKLGKCLMKIQNHEDVTGELNELFYSVRQFKSLAEQLDEYIHAYIKHQEEVNDDAENDENEPRTSKAYYAIHQD